MSNQSVPSLRSKKPRFPGYSQVPTDSAPRPKPAVTPRREWQSMMRQFGPIWMHEFVSGSEPGSNGAVIQ